MILKGKAEYTCVVFRGKNIWKHISSPFSLTRYNSINYYIASRIIGQYAPQFMELFGI